MTSDRAHAAGQARILQAYFRHPLGARVPHDLAPVGQVAARTVQRSAARPSAEPVRVFRAPAGFLGPGPHRAGQPLPAPLLRKMEKLFDADLSTVRVHVAKDAARIQALAFTTGEEIYVAPGLYHPHTRSGEQLLGHELAHVLQQRAGLVTNPLGAGLAVVQDDALEAEADRFGRLAAGQPGPIAERPSWRAGARASEAHARGGHPAAAQRLVRTGPQALMTPNGGNLTGAGPLVVQPWGAAAWNLAAGAGNLAYRGAAGAGNLAYRGAAGAGNLAYAGAVGAGNLAYRGAAGAGNLAIGAGNLAYAGAAYAGNAAYAGAAYAGNAAYAGAAYAGNVTYNLAADSLISAGRSAQHAGSMIGSVASYGASTLITGPLSYAYEGARGAFNYLGGALIGTGQHLLRGLEGLAGYGRDVITGVLGYLYDTVTGPARFLWRLPGVYRGAGAHLVPIAGGGFAPVAAVRGGLSPLLRYILRGLWRAVVHVLDGGVGDTLRGATRGAIGTGRYLYDSVARPLGYLGQGGADAVAYAGRGRARLTAHVTRGLTGVRDEVGYFRASAIAFGLLGAAAAPWLGLSALQGLAAGGVPYLFDFGRFLQLQGYELLHPGYHSMARHSAWHTSGNLRNRRQVAAPPQSRMRDWTFRRVNQAPVSSQFRTSNWHWFSMDQAWQRLLALDPLAVLLWRQPAPQFPGFRFTIQYPGWDTGITHDFASGPGGVRTEYVFSNFIRDAAGGHNYFLVQHFPQVGQFAPGGVAGPHNTVVNTSWPI